MKIGKVGKSGGGGRFVFDCPKTNGEVQLDGSKGGGGDERGSAARQWQQFLAVLHSTKNTGRPLTILKK